MGKSVEEMYQEMLNDGSLGDFSSMLGGGLGPGAFGEDDGEDFLTSKEIVREKKLLEEAFSSNRPGAKGRGRSGPPDIEEEVHFKRYTTRREHKYTESEKQAIRESCMATIVHDYGEHDIYHQSDKERAEMDQLAEIRGKLSKVHRIYHKVDQYVEAMRVVMEAWEILEKSNIIHTKDEFYTLVAEGKIYSNSIIMPKLKKMDNYNIDMIIKYISNPDADARDLIPAEYDSHDSFYDDFMLSDDPDYQAYYDEYVDSLTEEEINEMGSMKVNQCAHEYAVTKMEEDRIRLLLDDDEVQFLAEHADDPPSFEVKMIPRRLMKGYDQRTFGKKKKKKGGKKEQYSREVLHTILNKIQASNALSSSNQYSRSYFITNTMFDTDKPERDLWDNIPAFRGSWANKHDVFLYDLMVREELMNQHPANQRYLTYADMEVDRFFDILEKEGVNTIELRRMMNVIDPTSGEVDSRTVAAKKKENKKLEAAVLQRLTKLNQSAKFRKLAAKAEKDLNTRYEEG